MPKKKETPPSFEKDLEQLEEIVTALEEGGLSLDESLKQFESGIKLARRCEKALTEAEKKIETLTKNAEGELETQPFGEDENAAQESKENPGNPAPDSPDPPEPPGEEDEDEELLF